MRESLPDRPPFTLESLRQLLAEEVIRRQQKMPGDAEITEFLRDAGDALRRALCGPGVPHSEASCACRPSGLAYRQWFSAALTQGALDRTTVLAEDGGHDSVIKMR
jgi:hypothetical protein